MKRFFLVLLVVLVLSSFSGCAELEQYLTIETQPPETANLAYLPKQLFAVTDSLQMALSFADGEEHGPYCFTEIPEHLELDTYTVAEPKDVSGYDRWLTVSSGDGQETLTVYDGYRDLLRYEDGDEVLYFRDSDGKTFESLRKDVDEAEYNIKRNISFISVGDPLGPMREFASKVYPEFRKNLADGSIFQYEAYDLIDYSVSLETSSRVSGVISYYAMGDAEGLPEDAEPGSGKFEDWYYCTEKVLLELQSDGAWHRVEKFTEADPAEPSETEPDETTEEY